MSKNSKFDGPSHNTRGSKRRQPETSLSNQEVKIQKMIANEIRNAIPSIAAAVKEALPVNTQLENTMVHATSNLISKSVRPDPVQSSDEGQSENNENLGTRPSHKNNGCSYKTFLSCKPMEFSGSEGAVSALRWLEKTEAVLAISKCTEEDKVLYASNLFLNEALE